jgi:hypothetical protein
MAGPKIIDSFLHVIKDAAFSAAVKAEGMIKARGYDTTVPSLVQKFPVPAAAIGTTAQAITIAQILTGILEEDPTGAAAWTFPIGSLLVAGIDDAAVGDCIDFCIINTDSDGADVAITVTAGASGCTIVGNVEVESKDTTADAISSGSGMFRIRIDNITSGSEAYTIYRMA